MTSKYGNVRTEADGIPFASKRESNRYKELKILEAAGVISDLQLQPRFELQPSFVHDGKKVEPIVYVGDFQYTDNESGLTILEDSKGFKTDVYRLKKKLLLFKYPHITFLET